jgi:hypothetical protein
MKKKSIGNVIAPSFLHVIGVLVLVIVSSYLKHRLTNITASILVTEDIPTHLLPQNQLSYCRFDIQHTMTGAKRMSISLQNRLATSHK